jgi:hypothetical protein
MGTPAYFPQSVAFFRSDGFLYDPLLAGECISQSAKIAASLGVLKRGTVLYGPAVGTPITAATNLTTATGAGAARAILAQDIDTGTGTAVTGLVYTQGKFMDTGMIFTAAGAASDAANLWDVGIYVLTVLARNGQLIPMVNLPATGGALPQSMPVKEAKKAHDELVESIKAARLASYPEGIPPLAPLPGAIEPAYATAEWGETKATPLQKAEEKAAQSAEELNEKQTEELEKLKAEFHEKLGELAGKQAKERDQLAEKSGEAIAHAQQANHQTQHPAPPPPAPPPPKK